ncbi:hypothetical protein OWR29_02905 [Actinoplanes sp. Pm04-4]|uniref:Lipoprotein n=1 Tax=Paractinoplanes pyxinae TaxID=2997416 RepID=A0ABT4ARS5_9ACTN|nr:hypothetical protein [Actinoplanes pyxinae]MCY1136931.1 hypothetical protein [Actinoplanes pyxinae]
MRALWTAAGALVVALAAGCGQGVGEIDRSELSHDIPQIRSLRLIDALPEPADLGPGWTLDTTSVDDEDYYNEYAISEVARNCEGASPTAAELTEPNEYTASVSMEPEEGPGHLWVRIAVDSPAGSADRLALIRAAYESCEVEGQSYQMLKPAGVDADESFGVRITEGSQVFTWVYARHGGLVVALSGREGVDAEPLLPKAMAEARAAVER